MGRYRPGLLEEFHEPVLLDLLESLPSRPVVYYIGSGGNLGGQIDWLALALRHARKRDARVFVLDIDQRLLDSASSTFANHWALREPPSFELQDATQLAMTTRPCADLILCLGLFGALHFEGAPTPSARNPEFSEAAIQVLKGAAYKLEPGGTLVLSNSYERQPPDEYRDLVRRAGLAIVAEGAAPGADAPASTPSREARYLWLLRN